MFDAKALCRFILPCRRSQRMAAPDGGSHHLQLRFSLMGKAHNQGRSKDGCLPSPLPSPADPLTAF